MPKAILEYDLSDPDDANDYRIVSQADAMHSALWEFDQLLRKLHKYGAQELDVTWPEDGESTMSQKEILESLKEDIAYTIREKLWEVLNASGVTLE